MTIRMHKKVKITVLRTEYYQELAEQYAISYLGKCPFHQKGQVLYSDGINPPDGMCGVAWQVIAPMARQLSLGEPVQPSGTWLNDDTIGVFACPDGIRPVIFLLEAE
ncbi:MAG: TIGR04076 family protein [Faecalibacterium prausnitzii]|nr:TIGR04076 family protein [Faecalibacterium prausnitzii]